MKVFKLIPNHAKNGWVRIRAISEERAREIAQTAFEDTNVKDTIHTPEWASVPWTNPSQVKCILEEEDLSREEGILGLE
jgi:hypothetical protein